MPKTKSDSNIGKTLRMVRNSRGMTIKELYAKSGVSPSHVSMVETGLREPTYGIVERIAKALDVPMPILVYLCGDTEITDAGLSTYLAEQALHILRSGGNGNRE